MQRNDEDNLEVCTECGNDTFEEHVHIKLHKNTRAREAYEMHMKIMSQDTKFVYKCTKCGHALDK